MKIYKNMQEGHMLVAPATITAKFLGVELEEVFIKREDQKKPEFLALNPAGQVPVLVTEQGNISQSAAITRYLARLQPEKGLYGNTLFESALIDQWVDYIAGTRTSVYQVLGQTLGFFPSDPQTYQSGMKSLREAYTIIDKNLEKTGFMVGIGPTVADIWLLSAHHFLFRLVFDENMRSGFKNLTKFMVDFSSRKEVEAVYGKFKLAKKSIKAPAPAKKEEEKKSTTAAPKAAAKPKAEDEDEPKEKKKESKLAKLPQSKFNFYDYKTLFANAPDKKAAINELWSQFDPSGYSIWTLHYDKAEGEGQVQYMTANLVAGFIQRLDNDFRRYSLGVHGVYGDEPNLEVMGCWIIRGTEIPEEWKDHPSFEYYKAQQLSHEKEEDRKTVQDFFSAKEEEDSVKGLKCREFKYFK